MAVDKKIISIGIPGSDPRGKDEQQKITGDNGEDDQGGDTTFVHAAKIESIGQRAKS